MIAINYCLSTAKGYQAAGYRAHVTERPKIPYARIVERMREKWPDRYPMGIPRKPSQYDVARLAGVKQPSVNKWTKGRPIDQTVLTGLATRLGVNIEWLATGRGDKFPLLTPEHSPRSELMRIGAALDELTLMELLAYARYLSERKRRRTG
jgi:transcriptional regulator with XRE-family HTH domain